MRVVHLSYGTGTVALRLPETALAGVWDLEAVLRGPGAEAPDDPRGPVAAERDVLARALDELRASGFADRVRGRRLGLLVADGTRAWHPERLLPALAPLLAEAARVDAFLCTGTHRSDTPENEACARTVREGLAGVAVPLDVAIHDARRAAYRGLGTTRRGTRIEVWERVEACEAFLILSDMKHHYFAGYSNPLKYVVPGVASRETARGNHSLALEPEAAFGRHPWHPVPDRRTNPVAEDMLEGFERFVGARTHDALVTWGVGDRVRWATAGPTAGAAARGMALVDERASLRLAPVRHLVVSAGGAPHDESLYTVQRALELSRGAVCEGGEVLFLARCPNGIGSRLARRNFYEPLTRPLAELRAPAREDYVLYGHKPVKLARLLERLTALHLHSSLPDDVVRAIHLRPAPDPQAVVDRWLADAGAEVRIGFLDDASRLAVLPPVADQAPR